MISKKTYIPAKPRNKKLIGGMMVASGSTASGGQQHSHANKPVIDRLTQSNIDVLSYLSLYQTGVEMEVLLDEFGDPVLDVNGDPVTEQIPIYAIKSTATFFSEKEVSAYGVGGEGEGGGSYDMLLSWVNYDTDKEQWVISAALAKDMLDRIVVLEAGGGGGSTVVWGTESGGYASLTVDSESKSVALSGHTHTWSSITGKPSTFTPSAHTHSAGDITSGTFAIARIPTGTTGTTVALGNHLHTGVYEPTFSKNTAFNKNFGTTSGTVAQGNDSRIDNGQTAYGWGNHASAGYALNSSLSGYVTTSRIITSGNGLTGGGTLAADRTITLGTPSDITLSSTNSVTTASHTHNFTLGGTSSQYLNGATTLVTIPTVTAGNGLNGGGQLTSGVTLTLATPGTLTAATTNGVTASSHTHAITTTSVGAANTIVQTDATGGTKLNNLKVGGAWKLEQVGTELQLKYNDVVAQRFLLDGSIVGLGEITAYGATTGGDGVALLRTGGTMTGNLTMDADIIMNSGRAIGFSSLPLNLLGNALTYNASNVLTEANTATQIKMGNGWTIEQTTASLTIRKDGVIKQTIPA